MVVLFHISCLILGLGVLAALLPRRLEAANLVAGLSGLALAGGLGWIIGVGVLGTLVFVGSLLGLPFLPALPWLVPPLVVLSVFAVHRVRSPQYVLRTSWAPSASLWRMGMLATLGLVVLCTAVFATKRFLRLSLASPHGQCDAYAIWNHHARQLSLAPYPRSLQTPDYSHPDYPYLLPGANVAGWSFTGDQTPAIPATLAFGFLVSLALIVGGGVSLLKGPLWGLLGMAAMWGTPGLVRLSASQYADVPVGCYMVASLATVILAFNTPSAMAGLLALSGVCASLAAWTKNEGIPFLVVLAVGSAILGRRHPGGSSLVFRRYCVGALPVVILLAIFKLFLAPANDIIREQGASTIARLISAERLQMVFGALKGQFSMFPGPQVWPAMELARFSNGLVLTTPVVLLTCALMSGFHLSRREIAPWVAMGVVLAQLAGYVLIYQITPHDLPWHLRTSLDRLLTQLLPSFVLCLLAASRGDVRVIDTSAENIKGYGRSLQCP